MYQLRGMRTSLYITPTVVAMDSCFVLIRTHQRSIGPYDH